MCLILEQYRVSGVERSVGTDSVRIQMRHAVPVRVLTCDTLHLW